MKLGLNFLHSIHTSHAIRRSLGAAALAGVFFCLSGCGKIGLSGVPADDSGDAIQTDLTKDRGDKDSSLEDDDQLPGNDTVQTFTGEGIFWRCAMSSPSRSLELAVYRNGGSFGIAIRDTSGKKSQVTFHTVGGSATATSHTFSGAAIQLVIALSNSSTSPATLRLDMSTGSESFVLSCTSAIPK